MKKQPCRTPRPLPPATNVDAPGAAAQAVNTGCGGGGCSLRCWSSPCPDGLSARSIARARRHAGRHTKRRARRRALPRARHQARLSSPTCCQGRRAPAAPVRCCARSFCGRRCWLEKQSPKTSCLLEITCSTKTPRGAGLRARLPEIFPAGKMISRCPSVVKPAGSLQGLRAEPRARRVFQTQLGFSMRFRGRRAASCPNPLLGAVVLWKTLLAGKTEYLNFFSS